MKFAKCKVIMVEFSCPHCGEVIPNPNYNYSHTWDVNEVPVKFKCSACGKEFMFPTGGY